MKGLKILVLSTLALSIVSPLYSSADVIPPKKTWWKKYGPKIMAGLAIAAAIGITVGAAYHANKVKRAIDKAGITDPEEYAIAVAVLSVLGPLGPDRALNFIWQLINQDMLTTEQASALIFSSIGSALAHYYGMSPAIFQGKAITKLGIKAGRYAWEIVKKAASSLKRGTSKKRK